jgi:hypothetical protein
MSNRGFTVDKPPLDRSASTVFFQRNLPATPRQPQWTQSRSSPTTKAPTRSLSCRTIKRRLLRRANEPVHTNRTNERKVRCCASRRSTDQGSEAPSYTSNSRLLTTNVLLQLSPQEHLDALINNRGYSVTSRRNTGKFGRASLSDEAFCETHNDAHIVNIVKRDNPEPLRALLAQGIKQNPCNSLGDSIANLACRLGSFNILKVLIGAGCDTKTSDTHGPVSMKHERKSTGP